MFRKTLGTSPRRCLEERQRGDATGIAGSA